MFNVKAVSISDGSVLEFSGVSAARAAQLKQVYGFGYQLKCEQVEAKGELGCPEFDVLGNRIDWSQMYDGPRGGNPG